MPIANVGPSALWYLTRATGAVALLLLTLSVALGIANIGRLQRPGWPRFVVEGLRRNVSLLALALLLVHIVTSLLDPFAGIKVIDAFIPFTGSYRPIWLGLGAFASDLFVAVALTSVARRRLGHRAWRATHWLAYASWPLAVVHAVGTGSDAKQVWLLALTAVCVSTVVLAVWARIGFGWPEQRRLRAGALAASIALPVLFVTWLPGGPLGKDWARRAGTPLRDLQPAGLDDEHRGRFLAILLAGHSDLRVRRPRQRHDPQDQTTSGLIQVDIALAVTSSSLKHHARAHRRHAALRRRRRDDGELRCRSEPRGRRRLFNGSVTSLDGTQNRCARHLRRWSHAPRSTSRCRIDAGGGQHERHARRESGPMSTTARGTLPRLLSGCVELQMTSLERHLDVHGALPSLRTICAAAVARRDRTLGTARPRRRGVSHRGEDARGRRDARSRDRRRQWL